MKLLGSVVCAILLAGVSCSGPRPVSKDAGDDYTFTIIAIGSTIATCHLKNPAGTTLDFTPGGTTQYGNRYELLPISPSMPSCSITVKNLQQSDAGLWEVSFRRVDGTGNDESFKVTVTGSSEIQDEEEIEDDNDDNVKWFNTIEFPTRTNQIIDISLPRIDHVEECFVRTPKGDNLRVSEVDIKGVTEYERSEFVSCRITIGPMEERLLGEWAICGLYTYNDKKHERCQAAKIYWNTENRPDTIWDTKTQERFDHPVHYDSTLTPVVIGNGNPVSCHVVTPYHEDLVIGLDSEYPKIKIDTLSHSTCSIAIGPIDYKMLGRWTVYGVFRNSVSGLNEERFPIYMFLYDPNNPYSQAYNVTVLDPVNRVVNFGNTLNVQVDTDRGQVDNCYFKTPSGRIYSKKESINFPGVSFVEDDEDSSTACRVAIGPITETLLGEWKITGKFSNDGLFTERQQVFRVIQEDPENPIEEDRIISYLSAQSVETAIGNTHRLVISSDVFIHPESCHVRTPAGLQYKIMEGFNVTGVNVIEESGVECGVIVDVVSEDTVGEWTLIARAIRHSEAIERRLPFTIYVEETAEAIPSEVTIFEGNNLYVRLKYPTDQYKTCRLLGPSGVDTVHNYKVRPDPLHTNSCGFIISDVLDSSNGTWTITYGNRIVYKAAITVTVDSGITGTDALPSTLSLVRDRPVAQAVGPENAVYCRLEDPLGLVVFDGFGRCNLTLDKVGLEHHGAWKMFVGLPGRVIAVEYQMNVQVTESEGKPLVTSLVTQDKPIVTISCFVQTAAEVQACKFRDPQGKILLPTSGVSEDRYSFHGSDASQSVVNSRECGIRITEPLTTDLGLWRCGIETAEETYYGHVLVLCPWAMMQPEVAAAVQQEPILTADRSLVTAVEEEPAIMSCTVEASIRYCYFRASNGTTFSVAPGMSSPSMEYVGAGFDAGECGVRFHGLLASDSGRWSCHVGIVGNATEQRAQYQLTVQERMRVNHFSGHGNVMTVEGIVYDNRPLEYCRFVRIDGFGFTSDSVPSEYTLTGIVANGECQFTARNPTILDLHPWTVVAKVRGQDLEISKDTMESIMITPPPPTVPAPEPEVSPAPGAPSSQNNGLPIFLYVFLCVMLVVVLLGVWLGPKRHRDWTHQRASAFRSSISGRFGKQQQPTTPNHNV